MELADKIAYWDGIRKSRMRNVMVVPATTEISAEIWRSLNVNQYCNLYGYSTKGAINNLFDRHEDLIADVYNPCFAEEVRSYAVQLDAIVIAGHDEALYQLKKIIPDRIPGPSFETIEICRFKSKTYEFFAGCDFCPKWQKREDGYLGFKFFFDCDDEVFAKPDKGQGSRGAFSIFELNPQIRDTDLIFCEYLPGTEYTVDCFTDRRGRLLYASPRVRTNIKGGIATETEFVDLPEAINIARIISSQLRMRGGWFFQLKEDKNKRLKLLEVAPRIAGSSGIVRVNGVNLMELTLLDYFEKDVQILPQQKITRSIRKLDEWYKSEIEYNICYIDFDDTLRVYNQKHPYNLDVVKLLYKNFLEGIENILITRNHDVYDIIEPNIANLFRKIIIVEDDETKSEAIIDRGLRKKDSNPIFIDDSFPERQDVSETLLFPVFDPHEISILL